MGGSKASLAQQLTQTFVTGDRWKLFLRGLGRSLLITVCSLAIGVVIGILIAIVRTLHDQSRGEKKPPVVLRILNVICRIYTTVIRGTPMMVQLLIMGFVVFSSARAGSMWVAVLTLGLNSGAYVAEIIRGGIMSIDPGQMEAGRSLGMGYGTVMKEIVIPQAIKNVLPSLGNELITLFKDTSLVMVIAVSDLTTVARDIQAKTYQPMIPYLGIALMYLVVVIILTWLLGKLERRLRKSDRR